MAHKAMERKPREPNTTNGTAAGETFASAEQEQWLLNNPEALAAVKRGLADSAAGRGVKMSFLEFADNDLED
ncbi:MAG: hypothetical protein M3Y13_15365 [Armatimonadota bacterium]|nr:hypothetical protein [Armatimonadota bacterium]